MINKQKLISRVSIVGLILMFGVVFSLMGTPAAFAGPIKLVIANWEPPKGTGSGPLREWLAEVEKGSNGRVTGSISYAAMGPPPGYYKLANKGIAHVTLIAPAYTPGQFPLSEVMQLPISGKMTSETFAKAYWKLYQKGYFDKEFKRVKVLYLGGMCPYDLHMTAGNDIKTIADMNGKKLRASGALHSEIVKAFGAIPVGMPAPEIPIAMEKGIIDGQFQHLGFVAAFRTEEITRSVTRIGISSLNFAVVMNKRKYNSLPGDVKKQIDEMGARYSAKFGKAHDRMAQLAKKKLAGAGSVEYTLSSTELKKLGQAVAPLWEKWISEKEAKGLPAKKIVKDLYNIFIDMGVENPFHGYVP